LDNADDLLAGLRLIAADGGQLGLGLDGEMPGDQVVEYDGSKVLLVENGLVDGLEGLTLDVADTPDGVKLVTVEQL